MTDPGYLVEYAEGEKQTAMLVIHRRGMEVEDELPYNLLAIAEDPRADHLVEHDCILSVEQEGKGRQGIDL